MSEGASIPCRCLTILGAGQLAVLGVEIARSLGIESHVFLAPRAADAADQIRALQVPVQVCEDLRSANPSPLGLARPDAVLLSLGSPFLVPADLVAACAGRASNCHNAPLPEWRGGGGFSWRIMENDRRGRTCVHVIVPGMDEGDMVLAADYEFPPSARIPRDYQRYSLEQAKPALTTFLASLAKGEPLKRLPQDHSSATYFPRLNTEAQAWIDWSWPGAKIESFILAFSHPYPGAKTALRGETTHIFDARFVPGTGHPFFAGLIVRSGPVVACIDGTIVCDEVQTPMLLRVGDRLVTPEAKLRQALEVRPIYTPKGLKPLFAG